MRMRLRILVGLVLCLGVGSVFAAERPSPTGPWDLKALRKAPKIELGSPQALEEKGLDGTPVKITLQTAYYEGEPLMGKPTRVFGYYARPEAVRGKIPAVVLVHGGGGTAFPQWARLWAARGYAALAMDLAGKGPERMPLPDGGPDQSDDIKFRRLKDGVKNCWSYHAVAAVIRGASALRAMKEVDANRMAITGISWGGYLTSIVMSLDDRFKAAVPVYGCGYLHENSAWVPILNQLPADERAQWIQNFDPSSYLARCKVPALWMNGTNDFAYPLDSYQKCYRLPKSPRTLCVTVKMPHGHEAGWARPEIHWFIDSQLNKEGETKPLTTIQGAVSLGDRMKVAYDSDVAMRKAEIHWTTDLDKPWQQREWKTAPGRIVGLLEAEADLPKTKPAVYFMTLTDMRGAVVSTEHAEAR